MKKMKKSLLLLILCLSVQIVNAQKYFKPVVGGLEDVETGKDYHLVNVEGKDSLQIHSAIMLMLKENFKGSEDKILESKTGSYALAFGVEKDIICRTFDLRIEVEFNVKNGRYIYKYTKFNIISYQGDLATEVIFQKGDVLSAQLTKGKVFLFNKKGKIRIKKQCYKDIIAMLDGLGNLFDVSKSIDKYLAKKKKSSDW